MEKRKVLVYTTADHRRASGGASGTRDADTDCRFVSDDKALAQLLEKFSFDILMIDNAVAADSEKFRHLMELASEKGLPVMVTRVGESIKRDVDRINDTDGKPAHLFKKLVLRRTKGETAFNHRERLNLVSDTAATLSHEINNPLMAITANIEMLLRKRRELDQGTIEKIEAIKHAADRIKKVTRRLTELESLKYRRTAAGRMLEIEDNPDREVLNSTEYLSEND